MRRTLFLQVIVGAGLFLIGGRFLEAQTVIMDQIGSNPQALAGNAAGESIVFTSTGGYPGVTLPLPSDAAVDDFLAPDGLLTLNNVQTVMVGGSTSNGPIDARGWEVNIYSSKAAALGNVTGDVAHVVLPTSAVTIVSPYNTDAYSGLVSLPVSIVLPHSGVYYVSVQADTAFPQSMGVYVSNIAGASPGGANGFEAAPGTGNNTGNGTADFAYRITAVPEPSEWAWAGVGILLFVVAQSRRMNAPAPVIRRI